VHRDDARAGQDADPVAGRAAVVGCGGDGVNAEDPARDRVTAGHLERDIGALEAGEDAVERELLGRIDAHGFEQPGDGLVGGVGYGSDPAAVEIEHDQRLEQVVDLLGGGIEADGGGSRDGAGSLERANAGAVERDALHGQQRLARDGLVVPALREGVRGDGAREAAGGGEGERADRAVCAAVHLGSFGASRGGVTGGVVVCVVSSAGAGCGVHTALSRVVHPAGQRGSRRDRLARPHDPRTETP
jgi:hypothetical protein